MGFLPSIGGKKKDKAAEASESAAAAPGEGDEKKAKESMAVFYTKHGADGKDRGPEYMDKEGDDDLTVGSLNDASSFVKELATAGGDFHGSGARSQA